MEPGRHRRGGRVSARHDGQAPGLRRAVAVADPVEVGVDPAAPAGGRVAVGVVVRAHRVGEQRGDELVVVPGVRVERRVDPRPGSRSGVAPIGAEAELRLERRGRPGEVRDAVDPDLAVDVRGARDGRDRVRQRGRPLQVRPADLEMRQRRHLVRGGALVAGRITRPHDVVVLPRVAEAGVRERRARERRVVRLHPAAARERAAVDVVRRGPADGVPREADAGVALGGDPQPLRRRRPLQVDALRHEHGARHRAERDRPARERGRADLVPDGERRPGRDEAAERELDAAGGVAAVEDDDRGLRRRSCGRRRPCRRRRRRAGRRASRPAARRCRAAARSAPGSARAATGRARRPSRATASCAGRPGRRRR